VLGVRGCVPRMTAVYICTRLYVHLMRAALHASPHLLMTVCEVSDQQIIIIVLVNACDNDLTIL
jgi:hypothetical protein